jgi:hypothetical protein
MGKCYAGKNNIVFRIITECGTIFEHFNSDSVSEFFNNNTGIFDKLSVN